MKNKIFRNRKAAVGKGTDIFLATLLLVGFILFITIFYKPESLEAAEEMEKQEIYINGNQALNYFLRSPLKSFDASNLEGDEREAWFKAFEVLHEPIVVDLLTLSLMDSEKSESYNKLFKTLFDIDENLDLYAIEFDRRKNLEARLDCDYPDIGYVSAMFPDMYSEELRKRYQSFGYCAKKEIE